MSTSTYSTTANDRGGMRERMGRLRKGRQGIIEKHGEILKQSKTTNHEKAIGRCLARAEDSFRNQNRRTKQECNGI